jgi:threonyl-tRNA synthetase
VELDSRAASLGAKIKDARNARIPYLLVVGAEEAANGTFAVRSRREGELGAMNCEDLAKKWQDEVDKKL